MNIKYNLDTWFEWSKALKNKEKYYQRKNGSQQARKADIIIPNVLAAFLSLFILLLLAIGGSSGKGSGDDWPTEGSPANPAEIPFICRCLFNKAAATLLLKHKKFLIKISSSTEKNLHSTNGLLFWTKVLSWPKLEPRT